MNQTDKIAREVLNLLNYSKDVATTNLHKANNSGLVEPRLTDEQITSVVGLLETSLNQGYQKAISSFQKSVKTVIEEKTTTTESKKKK